MRTAGIHRSLVVRVLLGCILFSLFACGLHHGQMSAGDLRGALARASSQQTSAGAAEPLHQHHAAQAPVQAQAATAHSHAQHDHDHGRHAHPHAQASLGDALVVATDQPSHPSGHAGHDQHQLTPAFSCPLCSSFGVALAFNSRAWSLPAAPRKAASGPVAAVELVKPRRALWNTLNPRAPPPSVPAVSRTRT